MLLLGDRLDDAGKQDLADAERQEIHDRADLVQPAVDAAVVAAQVVLGQDDVLVVEDLHADDPGGRGEREACHDSKGHAGADAAEMIAQGVETEAEDEHEPDENGGHRPRDGVAGAQEEKDDRRAHDQLE